MPAEPTTPRRAHRNNRAVRWWLAAGTFVVGLLAGAVIAGLLSEGSPTPQAGSGPPSTTQGGSGAAGREGFAARIIEPNGNVLSVAVHGGFLSVTKDGISILAEDAELRAEIDVTKARAAYERAKAQGTNSAEAEAELRRARAQLLAAGESI